MRQIAFPAFLLLVRCLHAVEPIAIGEWSEPEDRLRARLTYAEDKEVFNGTRIAIVYLELQNLSDGLGDLVVDFDRRALVWDVVDADGKPETRPRSFHSGPVAVQTTLVLPRDSNLRFRISVNGYGIPRGPGLAIPLLGGFWFLPPSTSGDRYLTASFTLPKLDVQDLEGFPKDVARGNDVWRGTLRIPKLKIPVQRMTE